MNDREQQMENASPSLKALNSQEIESLLIAEFGENAIQGSDHEVRQPYLHISPEFLQQVCLWLRDQKGLYFDMLSCLTGVDLGSKEGKIGVLYHLYSIPYGHSIVLKCFVSRELDGADSSQSLPIIPSVTSIWPTANWHEREAYDLVGIHFEGHPDLRRILMPEDWTGHPLRKDYENPADYHGIQTAY